MLRFFIFAFLFLPRWGYYGGALAQTTTAVCDATITWILNSKVQTPCLVAAYLLGACSTDGTISNVPPLMNSGNYTGPTTSPANNCRCSSVVYNLMSACALCQHGTFIPWTSWNSTCAPYPVLPGQFIYPIPPGTAVPGWAYITPDQMGGTFNPEIAQSALGLIESTAPSAPTPTGPVNTATNPSTSTSTPSAGSSKSTNVGPIVGGVVGGIAALAIISAIVFFIIRQSRKDRIAPSTAFSKGDYGSSVPDSHLSYPVGQYSALETPPFLDSSRYQVSPAPAPYTDSGFQYSHSHNPSLVMPQPSYPAGVQDAANPLQGHPFNPYDARTQSPPHHWGVAEI